MLTFLFLVSRQGKSRLERFYDETPIARRAEVVKDITHLVITRPIAAANVLETEDRKIVYKRYASLYFVVGMTEGSNELIGLEFIHHFVEVLDRYFGNVCELDLIFNFHKVHLMLDEIVVGGWYQETSKKAILRIVAAQDVILEDSMSHSTGGNSLTDFGKRTIKSL